MSVSSEPEAVAAGELLAPGYEAIAHVRRGNELDVYDAWSLERGCRCIVKAVRPDLLDDERTCANLLREGRLLTSFNHPHLVRGYEVFEKPSPVFAMETLTGQTLDHLIGGGDLPLEATEAAQMGLQLASAIGYLHLHGVLHLDVKPDNMVIEGGRAKLIDLNLARPPGPAPAGIGTWCYLAPEQARGDSLTAAADVWGIGVVMFEALTGSEAFGGEEEFPQLVHPAPELPADRGLPRELTDLVASCLSASPTARPTVAELISRLELIAGVSHPRGVRSFSWPAAGGADKAR